MKTDFTVAYKVVDYNQRLQKFKLYPDNACQNNRERATLFIYAKYQCPLYGHWPVSRGFPTEMIVTYWLMTALTVSDHWTVSGAPPSVTNQWQV